MNMKRNVIRHLAAALLSIGLIAALSASLFAFALSDGAYLVSRTTSYADPETGKTVDGGTDIALGDSMCASIVDDKVLVEKVGDQYYVTLGLGLMSNITNVRMQVQQANGTYKSVPLTKTGSCTRDDDTCNHYRFPMSDPSKLISPIFYVTPMGRDVQFFVRLNMGSAVKGSGNFAAEMVKETGKTRAMTTKTVKAQTITKAAKTVYEQKTAEYGTEQSGSYSEATREGGKKLLLVLGIGVAAFVVLISLILIIRNKRY